MRNVNSGMPAFVNGIQQIGLGVHCAATAFEWYKKALGFDAIVFEDKASAALMTRYTGGVVQQRYAALAMNMQGGAGLELWQYTERKGSMPHTPPRLGHTGIFAIKIRCRNIQHAHRHLQSQVANTLDDVMQHPQGYAHFFVADPFGNWLEIVEDNYWFTKKQHPLGGVCGAVIGVNAMESATRFYTQLLGYEVCYENAGAFEDWKVLPGSDGVFRRTLLQQTKPLQGPFGRLLGTSQLELVQAHTGHQPQIYDGRWWGDPGFIHICFDVANMAEQKNLCAVHGYPFTVDSGSSFGMGTAAGHFAYNEDPDGTLIEYVETHRVPILKKWNWYLNLNKRPRHKPLPNWIVRCMGLSKKGLQEI